MARKVRWDWIFLGLLLVTLFWFRMSLATSVENLSYDSYLTVREVEHIQSTGEPLTDDPLSITGKERVGSPLFSYLLAALVFFSDEMYKIVPNFIMVLLLIPLYYLTLSFTKSKIASFLATVLAGTGPFVFSSNLNTVSAVPLSLGIFLTIIFLLKDPDKYLYWIVGLTLFLTFLSPIIFVLVLSLLLIVLILKLEGFGVDRRVGELFFFTLMLAVWFNVLIFKKALFTEGVRVLWKNLPVRYVTLQFGDIVLIDIVYGLGVITFLFGVFGIYHALFESRVKISFSVIASIIAVSLLLLLGIIESSLGFLFLTILLSVMAGYGLLVAARYFAKTKTPWFVYPLWCVVGLLFIFTAVIPAFTEAQNELDNTPSSEDIAAFQELRSELPRGAVLLTTVREGAAVQYFSDHITLTDEDFLLVKNGDELVRDIDSVYTSLFSVTIVGKADKLGFTHVLFSGDAVLQYDRFKLRFEESLCVSASSLGSVLVYQVMCTGGDV